MGAGELTLILVLLAVGRWSWWIPRLTNSVTIQAHIQGFEVTTQTNIYSIYDLLERVKGLFLLTHRCKISMTWAIAGYSRGVLVRVQY